MIIELNRCDIVVDIDSYIEKGEPGCSYGDGSYHQGIPDELVVTDIRIREVHFDNSIINSKWLRNHPDWVAWLVGIVEDIVTDHDSVYFKQLINRVK